MLASWNAGHAFHHQMGEVKEERRTTLSWINEMGKASLNHEATRSEGCLGYSGLEFTSRKPAEADDKRCHQAQEGHGSAGQRRLK